MRLSLVGAGHVGLVTGACFAEMGHEVRCVDHDRGRVDALNQGRCPIFEKGLPELIAKHSGRRLIATTNLADAVRETEVTFIAVGTPVLDGSIDLSAIHRAAEEIGTAMRSDPRYHVVVVKSTVPPGTTDTLVRGVLERATGRLACQDFGLVMNPEFLSEGEAVDDALHPDRLVIGAMDERSAAVVGKVYLPYDAAIPRLVTNPRTAEMIKYASNALLATLISFSNELANLGSARGDIDSTVVMRGLQLSQYFRDRDTSGLPRVTTFLKAGCGYGGSCLPKDLSALIEFGAGLGVATPVLNAVQSINSSQPGVVVDLLRKHYTDLRGVRVAVLGLAFKPDTSDVRCSPAFPIIRQLLDAGAFVTTFDPVAASEARIAFPDSRLQYASGLVAIVEASEAIIVVTPWKEFAPLPHLINLQENPPLLIDPRRMFAQNSVPRYEGIGL